LIDINLSFYIYSIQKREVYILKCNISWWKKMIEQYDQIKIKDEEKKNFGWQVTLNSYVQTHSNCRVCKLKRKNNCVHIQFITRIQWVINVIALATTPLTYRVNWMPKFNEMNKITIIIRKTSDYETDLFDCFCKSKDRIHYAKTWFDKKSRRDRTFK
jgi:hypothetical protein